MTLNMIRTQITVTPVAPPPLVERFKHIVGNLDPVWWVLLVAAIAAAALGLAAKSQDLRFGDTRLSAAVLGTAAVLLGGLSVFLLIWGV
ncbi:MULTISPECIES: hypothetical protein [Nocardiaceae]|uniref:hypothetical protein n=2 Tax=Mycobacteriales TaxID=85007 RepID=UPI0012E340B4|nr:MULTISPECIES: hypothetical protein [Rhodococcus]WQH31171.1 hypothetical protein U2G91_26795 [Rhodococcus fascians]